MKTITLVSLFAAVAMWLPAHTYAQTYDYSGLTAEERETLLLQLTAELQRLIALLTQMIEKQNAALEKIATPAPVVQQPEPVASTPVIAEPAPVPLKLHQVSFENDASKLYVRADREIVASVEVETGQWVNRDMLTSWTYCRELNSCIRFSQPEATTTVQTFTMRNEAGYVYRFDVPRMMAEYFRLKFTAKDGSTATTGDFSTPRGGVPQSVR